MFSLATALRTARAGLIVSAIDGGAGPGIAKVYTAPKPAAGAAITTQTLLGTLTFSDPCGTVANGVLSFSPITEDASADATGDAAWLRVEDSNGAFVLDGDIGLVGSGAFLELNTVSIVAGGPISIGTTRTITEGNA